MSSSVVTNPDWCAPGYICYTLAEAEKLCVGKGDDCTLEAAVALGVGILGTLLVIGFVGWAGAKFAALLGRR